MADFTGKIDELLDGLVAAAPAELETAVKNYETNDILAVVAKRLLDLEENGGSLPDWWTVGTDGQGDTDSVTLAGTLIVDAGAIDKPVRIIGDPNNTFDALVITDSDNPDAIAFGVDPFGYMSGQGVGLGSGVDVRLLDLDGSNNVTKDVLRLVKTGAIMLRINPGGYLLIKTHSAPADADIAVGECGFWFDQTDGAAKLMIKGKSADGTVVTGQVALA